MPSWLSQAALDAWWKVLVASPVFTFTLIFVCVGAGYVAARWRYAAKIDALEGRINFGNDVIADYKRKLDGASPDQAKARLDALELQVRALQPRRLSDEQRRQVAGALSRFAPAGINIDMDLSASDGQRFGKDFEGCFQAAGWAIGLSFLGGHADIAPQGLALIVGDLKSFTPPEQAIEAALRAAGLDFEVRTSNPGTAPGLLITPAAGTP